MAVASGALVGSAGGHAVAEEQPGVWHAPGASKARGRKKTTTKTSGVRVSRTVRRTDRRHHAGARGRGTPAAPGTRTLVLVTPSPGPLPTPEAARAMDQVRRNQIERAESAARRPELTGRWQTVEFLLNGVDAEHYPEAGFWRALSAYRRGDIEGGDRARVRAHLAARDVTALDSERTVAHMVADRVGRGADRTAAPVPGSEPGDLQTASFVPGSSEGPAGAGERIRNDAPYVGPGPAARPGLATN